MITLIVGLLLIVLLIVLLKVKKKQDQAAKEDTPSVRTPVSTGKMAQSLGVSESQSFTTIDNAALSGEEGKIELEQTFELDDSNWVSGQAAEISVSEVDDLSEFNVYKQFGYFDKAAQSLASYLAVRDEKPKELIFELCGLYLESGDLDGFVQSLEDYHSTFERNELEDVVKMAFELDPNNLGLRVFAEKHLGWGVEEVATNIVKEESILEVPATETPKSHAEEEIEDAFKTSAQRKRATYIAQLAARKPLVHGFKHIPSGTNADERSTIISFLSEEKAARFLGKEVSYVSAVSLYNHAVRESKRPAGVLIDALSLDFHNNNINNYAEHLWNLYFVLGKYGRVVKERMLGWGYTLGSHPVFTELEQDPDEVSLREIGVRYEYIPTSVSVVKAQMLPLVVEDRSQYNQVVGSGVDAILQETESQLMYGQIDEATITLENGILANPQEAQLYSMLFDLYERSENWGRFEDFSVKVRSLGVELPEAAAIALSHLTQRMNK
ncbi:MAG: 23S rRNA methyltransferase [Neisseriaceae bacterium]|nr:23S rRNA methyltransferase [Neisseriaceae bacterium]